MEQLWFTDQSRLLHDNPPQRHYGVAVTDVDNDGELEFVVAGYGCPNQALKWDGKQLIDIADARFADAQRQAIGVAAGDIDGDGREEIYILNTDSFAGRKQFADRLFHFREGHWRDLFALPENGDALNLTAGRSVAVVDRTGIGIYSFFVANYGGPMRCYEMDEYGFLADVAPYLGLAYITGGRSLLSLPLLSPYMDIFAGNESGPNFLFLNNGDGTYRESAAHFGLEDAHQHARGISVVDVNGQFGIVIGNWDGPHRLFFPTEAGRYANIAPLDMAIPSLVRTVIAADFDNDGYQEIFFNNIGESNRLFAQRNGTWEEMHPGDALEPFGLGTGAAIADINEDGRLELLIAHGETGVQPLSFYSGPQNDNNWLRILPLTAHGAPARGAVVTIEAGNRTQRRAVDAGSGYLCQMEPVAHFGLGTAERVEKMIVRWPDGVEESYSNPPINQMHRLPHPVSD